MGYYEIPSSRIEILAEKQEYAEPSAAPSIPIEKVDCGANLKRRITASFGLIISYAWNATEFRPLISRAASLVVYNFSPSAFQPVGENAARLRLSPKSCRRMTLISA